MAQITTPFDRVCVQSDAGERGQNVGARSKLKDRTCEAGVLGQVESGLCAVPRWGFPGGSVVKNLLANEAMQVQHLGREDALEKVMATLSSVLSWEILWTEEPGGLQPWGHKEMDST